MRRPHLSSNAAEASVPGLRPRRHLVMPRVDGLSRPDIVAVTHVTPQKGIAK